MSERKRINDDVLDHNVEQLMTRAHEPPRIAPDARARILTALASRVANDAAAEPRSPRRDRERWWSGRPALLAGAAAACVAMAALAIRARTKGGDTGSYANSEPAAKRVELADGSELILDRDAAVDVLDRRRVRVRRGKVLLDVAPGDGRFVVETAHGRMIVLGTRFVVGAGADRTWAAVVRGKVRIQNAAGAELLRAGERGELSDDARPTRRPAARLSHLTSFARSARRRDERPGPQTARKGTLLARDPEGRWQQEEFPLPMRRLDVDVHVENQIARVAIDQTFYNGKDRQLEGVYHFPLPPGAAVSRQAMYVNGKLMESAIVERRRGREIYEEIVYTRRDPALMEWMAGNLFKVRIFPLPPRQEKRILLSYTQPLERLYDDYRLTVPLPELDAPVDRVRYRVRLAGCADCKVTSTSHRIEVGREGNDAVVSFERRSHEIGDDFILSIRDRFAGTRVVAHRQEQQRYWMARLRPALDGAAVEHVRRRWVVLHDTSASRSALERKAQAFLIDRLLGELDEDDEIEILSFDTTVRRKWTAFQRVADVDRRAVATFLREQSRAGVGATDLHQVLARALELLAQPGDAAPHILYLGDGIVTGGERELGTLRELVAGKATVVAVAVGDRMDATVMRGLADATGGMFSVMNPGDDLGWRAFDLIAALNTTRITQVRARLLDDRGEPLAGAETYTSSQQLADGEELSLVARLGTRAPAAVELRGMLGAEPWSQRIALPAAKPGPAGYLPRLWAQRRIDALIAEDATAHKAEITKLGIRHFLITPFTSLLVLENDEMYKRYKVRRDRRAGWARYPAPSTIEVVRDKIAPRNVVVSAGGKTLVRAPTKVFYDYAQRWRGRGDGFIAPVGGAAVGGGGVVDTGVVLEGNMGVAAFDEETERENRGSLPSSGPRGDRIRNLESLDFGARLGGVRGEASGVSASTRAQPGGKAGGLDKHAAVSQSYFATGLRITADDLDNSINTVTTSIPLATEGQLGWNRAYWYNPAPIAFHYSRDPRLDDLTEWVPGLFSIPFDVRKDRAERGPQKPGSIDRAARLLIWKARARQRGGRYRLADDRYLDVDRSGHIQIAGRLPSGLTERLVYDGDRLHHTYPELGLATERRVGDAEAFLFGQLVPFVLPRADSLARWYRVTTSGPRTLVLAPRDGKASVIDIVLDDQLRIARVIARQKTIVRDLVRVSHDGDRSVIRMANEELVLTRVGPAAKVETRLAPDTVVVEMPLRQPAYWSERVAQEAPGSKSWRHALRQLLASLTAAKQPTKQLEQLEALRKHGTLARGELVLASGTIHQINKLDAMLALPVKDDPVAGYLRAAKAFARDQELSRFNALAKSAPRTLVGMLSSYRGLLWVIERNTDRADAERRFEAFADDYPHPTLLYIAANAYSGRWGYRNPRAAARLWDRLGTDSWVGRYGQRRAIQSLSSGRAYDEAARRAMKLLDGDPANIFVDHTIKYAFTSSSRGQAGWRVFWNRWRNKVLDSKRIDALLRFAATARRLGETADAERALARLSQAPISDLAVAAHVADALQQAGRFGAAATVLKPWLALPQPPAALLARASRIAEKQGRIDDAIGYLDRKMKAYQNQRVSLAMLRGDFAHLVRLHTRKAQSRRGGERDRAAERALRAAAAWRQVDPDNAEIDRMAASLLYSIQRPEEAWRHLSSAIERHPMEGASYQVVADVLEREGRVAEAEPLWERASKVDPTNPTWLLRHAQALSTLGKPKRASAVLDRIETGKWHVRFRNVTQQIPHMRKALGF